MGERKRRYTKIQTERVLRDIIARRLLSLQELAVCAYVWAHSWGFKGRRNTGPNKVSGGAIGAWCQMNPRDARRIKADLIRRGILKVVDHSLEFNEHTDSWLQEAGLITPTRRGVNHPGVNHPPRGESPLQAGLITPTGGVNHPSPYMVLESTLKALRKHKNPTRAVARDAVWEHFKMHYQTAYGEDPTPTTACFVNLARIRKAHTDEVIKQRVERLFLWRPEWLRGGRWTFLKFVRHFDEIPAGDNGDGRTNPTGNRPFDDTRFRDADRRAHERALAGVRRTTHREDGAMGGEKPGELLEPLLEKRGDQPPTPGGNVPGN